MSSNINNLNIFTFIKDIYQSLKHIDKCFNDFNTNINLRLSKIEDNQLILTNKLSEIEIILQKANDINTSNIGINKNIENELLEKMKQMNTNNLNNTKIELKHNELTFANIMENNYSFQDISMLSSIPDTNNNINNFSNEFSNDNNYYNNTGITDGISDDNFNNITDNNLNNLLF